VLHDVSVKCLQCSEICLSRVTEPKLHNYPNCKHAVPAALFDGALWKRFESFSHCFAWCHRRKHTKHTYTPASIFNSKNVYLRPTWTKRFLLCMLNKGRERRRFLDAIIAWVSLFNSFDKRTNCIHTHIHLWWHIYVHLAFYSANTMCIYMRHFGEQEAFSFESHNLFERCVLLVCDSDVLFLAASFQSNAKNAAFQVCSENLWLCVLLLFVK
jgi:hypothetical protein